MTNAKQWSRAKKKRSSFIGRSEDIKVDAEYLKEDGYTIEEGIQPTAAELAHWCDQEAESANYHSFVGTHEKIQKWMSKNLGDEAAQKFMRWAADSGGLHEM